MVTSASAASRPTIIVNGAREVVDMTPAVGWALTFFCFGFFSGLVVGFGAAAYIATRGLG